jgi:HK97 family phage portal protein
VPSLSGVYVDEQSALQYSAVYACVRYISETVASLPWRLMKRRADGGADVVKDSPTHWLLFQQPNPETSAYDFKRTMEAHRQTWGNGYAEIVRDGAGRPQAMHIITPDRVSPKRISGDLWYEVDNGTDQPTMLPARDVFHLRGLGWDGLVGYSPISMARQAIGLGIGTEQFGAAWFGNGSHGSGVLESPTPLSPERAEALRKQFEGQHRGTKAANRMVVLEGGTTYKPVSIPPDDAQFLQTRTWQVGDICRWYRVPPHKCGLLDRATFSNIEHQSIEAVQDAIISHTMGWEGEAQRKLIGQPARHSHYTHMSVQALLRGDHAARSSYYHQMWQMGVLSVNEIRGLEDLNPIEDGDKHLVQMNITTLEAATDDTQPEPAPQPPAPDDDDDQDQAARSAEVYQVAMLEPLAQAIGRCLRKEGKAMHQAAQRDRLAAKLPTFYEQHQADVADAIQPLALGLARCIRGGPLTDADARLVGAVCSDYAAGHVATSVTELEAAQGADIQGLADLWCVERAPEAARTITAQVADILTEGHTDAAA